MKIVEFVQMALPLQKLLKNPPYSDKELETLVIVRDNAETVGISTKCVQNILTTWKWKNILL